jgi:hypothetical protein
MTYSTEIMTAAFNHSMERCDQITKERGEVCDSASGVVESSIGTVVVQIVIAKNSGRSSTPVYRKTWRLNGKVISSENLANKLNNA